MLCLILCCSYGLLGPSGCGKTTLLKCIVGTLKISRGQITVLGKPPAFPGHNVPGKMVGYMPQVSKHILSQNEEMNTPCQPNMPTHCYFFTWSPCTLTYWIDLVLRASFRVLKQVPCSAPSLMLLVLMPDCVSWLSESVSDATDSTRASPCVTLTIEFVGSDLWPGEEETWDLTFPGCNTTAVVMSQCRDMHWVWQRYQQSMSDADHRFSP